MSKSPQQWQADFETAHGPIADLVALLRQNCNTYKTIGDKYGVTREMVRQWRNKIASWFDLLTEKHIRQKTCALQRLFSSPPPIAIQPLFEALRNRGLNPKLYITRRPETLHNRVIYLNGHKCHVSWIKTLSYYPKPYWHVQVSKSSLEPFFLTFIADPIRAVYVFPRNIIFQACNKNSTDLFIQLSGEPSGYNNNFPRIHWPDYKEAWHLVERKKIA